MFCALGDKIKICHAHSKGVSNVSVEKQYGIAESVIRRIVNSKNLWIHQVRDGVE